MKKLPTIAVTMGDAAGIGPEVVVKALAGMDLTAGPRLVIIGDLAHLDEVRRQLGIDVRLTPFESGKAAVEVYDLKNVPSGISLGMDAAETGKASAENIEAAIRLWQDGKIDAISTAPISKAAIHLGGFLFPGHTEFLAELTRTEKFAMSFFAEKLRVVLLSTHLSLLDAVAKVKADAIIDLISFSSGRLTSLLGKNVRLAVAGLNPHASEGGLFGREEIDEIIPAIEHCRHTLGIDVDGPFSPDTIFLRCWQGEYDAVIAMYHDQATIPVKALSFGSGVNVTLGLPLVRTSVDHGTAYAIAGKGIADPSSMVAAIKLAGELAKVSRA